MFREGKLEIQVRCACENRELNLKKGKLITKGNSNMYIVFSRWGTPVSDM